MFSMKWCNRLNHKISQVSYQSWWIYLFNIHYQSLFIIMCHQLIKNAWEKSELIIKLESYTKYYTVTKVHFYLREFQLNIKLHIIIPICTHNNISLGLCFKCGFHLNSKQILMKWSNENTQNSSKSLCKSISINWYCVHHLRKHY